MVKKAIRDKLNAYYKATGAKIKAARKAAGLKQKQLAEKAELPLEWIERAEKGTVAHSGYAVEKIAKVLNVETESLYPELPYDDN